MSLRILLTEAQIQARIKELGAQIDADYPTGALHLVCILKGAYVFLADLARAIQREAFVEFMGISSYGKNKTSSGQVKVTKDLDHSVEGANVLIVEDIVDSGVTLSYLMQVLQQRKPRSVRIAALLDKPSHRVQPVHADYVGFTIEDFFVVGYGMDCAERYRNLPDICILSPEMR